MDDYFLGIFDNVLQGSKLKKDLSTLPSVKETWERSLTLQGGYWLGRCQIHDLDVEELRFMFYNFLGLHLQERQGTVTWEGLIYELTLHDTIVRRLSLETVANKVRGAYLQCVKNPGLERVSGGTPVFSDWSQVANGLDSINDDTTNVATGSHAARLTRVSSGNTYLYQDIEVLESRIYEVSFYSRGDGSVDGRYRLQKLSGGISDIIPLTNTGFIATRYQQLKLTVVTPAGCTLMRLYLQAPAANGSAYFDEVSVKLMVNDRPLESLTAVAEVASSKQRFGIKETLITGQENKTAAEQARDQHLNVHAWPQVERAPIAGQGKPTLEIVAAGYSFTTKWVLNSLAQYSETQADQLVALLLSQCEYLSTLVIKTNTTPVFLDGRYRTVRQALNLAIEAADNNGTPWRLYVTANRTAVFEALAKTPAYILRGGKFYPPTGPQMAVAPRLLTPAVVRDQDYPFPGRQVGSWFDDRRDFLLQEVVVGPGGLTWREGDIA